jgi:hypothetical protein
MSVFYINVEVAYMDLAMARKKNQRDIMSVVFRLP